MTCGRLYLYDTLLQRLAQDFEHVVAELRPLVQKEDAVVRPRHFARHRHLAADQLHIGNRLRRGAKGRVISCTS
jgi:hypothetical protein